jgi:hypothetical protein
VRDRHVLVTGASSGIGRALSLRLGRDGARVSLVARRPDALEEVADAVRSAGGEAAVLPCDVSQNVQVVAAAAAAESAFGPVHLLVNNAGYGRHQRFVDHDVADMEQMFRVNTLGSIYVAKALLPAMIRRGRGWIVFIASVAGKIASPDESVYAATKFATVGLASALGLELEDDGIHVLTVCPGVIRTPFFDEEALSRMPPASLRRMVEPDGLADAILRALGRGLHEITYPRSLAFAYRVQAIAPEFMRRQVRRHTIDAVTRRKRDEPTG